MIHFLFYYQDASKINCLQLRLTVYGFLSFLTLSIFWLKYTQDIKIYLPSPPCTFSQERSCNSYPQADQYCCVFSCAHFLHNDCTHSTYAWGKVLLFQLFLWPVEEHKSVYFTNSQGYILTQKVGGYIGVLWLL